MKHNMYDPIESSSSNAKTKKVILINSSNQGEKKMGNYNLMENSWINQINSSKTTENSPSVSDIYKNLQHNSSLSNHDPSNTSIWHKKIIYIFNCLLFF